MRLTKLERAALKEIGEGGKSLGFSGTLMIPHPLRKFINGGLITMDRDTGDLSLTAKGKEVSGG